MYFGSVKESFQTSSLPDIYQEMFPVFKSGFFSSLFPHFSSLEIGKCTAIKATQFPLKSFFQREYGKII